jgi:hypothetical protein
MAAQSHALVWLLPSRCVSSGGRTTVRRVAVEVSELLKKAWAAVEEARLPDGVQGVAFREAMRVLAPSPGPAAAPPQRDNAGTGRTSSGTIAARGKENLNEDGGIQVPEEEIFDKVAEHTGVDRSKLEEIVHLDGGDLRVNLPGFKLGSNNAERARTVAQILTIVRGFGLDENETSVEEVRREVIRLKCYDGANFSSQLRALNGFLVTGAGPKRRIRAKAGGIQAFPNLVDTLSSES